MERAFFHFMDEDVSVEPTRVAPAAEPAQAPEAARTETGAETTPRPLAALAGGGILLLLGGLMMAYRRRAQPVHMEE
jgi:hypothetical protein